jgi:hypothetical protein
MVVASAEHIVLLLLQQALYMDECAKRRVHND